MSQPKESGASILRLPGPYYLDNGDFVTAPDKIYGYRPFENVQRNTFMSFIIRTFIESPKSVPLQATYCFFVQFKTGFLVEKSIRAILDHQPGAFAFDRFTSAEHDLYFSAYDGLTKPGAIHLPISRHLARQGRTKIHSPLTPDAHARRFELAMQDLVQAMHVRDLAFHLYPSMPWAEFQHLRETYLYSDADAPAQK